MTVDQPSVDFRIRFIFLRPSRRSLPLIEAMIPRCPTRVLAALLAVVCLQASVTSEAFASLPILTQVLPRGVQRGTEHKLTFVGLRLKDAEEILFYDEGFRIVDFKVIDSKKVEVTVEVDPGCRLGEHMVQVRARTGVTGYRIIQVEAYPAVAEQEFENNNRRTAQLIEPRSYSPSYPDGVGVVVSGRINSEDHDWYAVDGVAGQRLSVEVVGMRLGDFCDGEMELFGPAGDRIANVDDTPFSKQDPSVSVELPADGRYLIHLADAAGKGGKNAWYRLHVGNFPRPAIAVPAVVKQNKLSEITFLGDALGPIEQSLQVGRADLYQDGIHVRDRLGSTPTPVAMRMVADDVEIVNEIEPNDRPNKLGQEFSIPFSVYGQINSQKDRDVFCFDALKNQRVRCEVFGYRIGSAIDTTIRVRGEKNRMLAANADAGGSDSRLVATIPSDGSYTVVVQNINGGFGPLVRYQLDVRLEQPSFNFAAKEIERFTQQRQQIAVPAGNRFALILTAQRNEFDGSFQLNGGALPDSIRMFSRPMPAGGTTMPVVFEAAPFRKIPDREATGKNEAAEDLQNSKSIEGRGAGVESPHGQLIEFVGQSVAESRGDSSDGAAETVAGHYLNRAPLMRVAPGNLCMKFGVVNKVAVARLDPVPFKVDLVPPPVPISQGGRMKLRVNVTREEGFKAPITLRLPFLPPGIGAAPTVRVKPDQTTVEYPINANSKAAVASWPICVTAVAPNDQGAKISSGLCDLKIMAPFVSIRGDMVSTEAGSQVIAKCRVETLKQFEGTATVRLTQLPAHVTSEPQQFSADDQEIQFPIVVGKKCETKKNHPVKLEVTIEQDGHPIVADAGRLLMRFSGSTKRDKKTSRRQRGKVEKQSRGQQ